MWALAVFIGVGIIIFILYKGSKSEKEMEEVFNQISEDCKLSGIRQNEQFQKDLLEKYAEFGNPTTEICFHDNKWEDKGLMTRSQYYEYGWTCKSIIVWQDKKMFLLLGEDNEFDDNPIPKSIQKPLPFDVLLSCEAVDDSTIVRGDGQSITKTSKLGIITRGAVGGALLGAVGALAGALTANTTTTTSFNPDNVIHDYKIFVTLNDFSCPMLTLKFGQSEIQMRQVLSILNLIIKNS